MSQTHHCQTCGRAVVLTGNGEIIRSCIFSDSCVEPVAAKMKATCYSIAALQAMTPEERAKVGI